MKQSTDSELKQWYGAAKKLAVQEEAQAPRVKADQEIDVRRPTGKFKPKNDKKPRPVEAFRTPREGLLQHAARDQFVPEYNLIKKMDKEPSPK